MPNQIDGITKKCRVKEVINLSNKFEIDFYKQKINNIYDGVIETRKDKKVVITTNYIPVIINTDLENNTKVNIKITKVTDSLVFGKLLTNNK